MGKCVGNSFAPTNAQQKDNLLKRTREEAPPADVRGLVTARLRAPAAASEILRVRSGAERSGEGRDARSVRGRPLRYCGV